MTKLRTTAALVVAFFVSDAQGAEDICDGPGDVEALMREGFPSASLWHEREITDVEGGAHHVQVYRSPGASTDFAVIFDKIAGDWCAVSSMELPKLGEAA